jgi:hypothetical protein
MTPEVTFRYIPRSLIGDPHIRVTIFREYGSAILEIDYAAIAEICEPKSDGRDDLVRAFRQSLPELLGTLNAIIASTPPGGVVFVTPKMLRSRKISAARNRSQANKVDDPRAMPAPSRAALSEHRSSKKSWSQTEAKKRRPADGWPTPTRSPYKNR